MSYTALEYYALVILLVALYYVLPKKNRWISLLAGSVFFYKHIISENKELAVFIISIIISYFAGIFIEAIRAKAKMALNKIILMASILLISSPLILQKIIGGIPFRFSAHISSSLIIPVGLSFYTLQLIAYIVDVYNGKITAQRNPLKFGLFASFFPQIIQGPIPRYERLSKDLFDGNDYCFNNIISGAQLIIWGFFLKYMIADKSAVFVNTVFDNYTAYSGGYIWIAAILYSIQLYADFLSCTTLSQGVSELFGIHLADNFMHPYFSTSIKDFWRRWHMSLSKWLRDYIYIPLGGNRKGRFYKWINILITFAISGIWHGGSAKYLVWGLVHAIYQIVGEIKDLTIIELNICTIIKNSSLWKMIQQIITFFLVMFAWIIFRAESFKASIEMFQSMFVDINPWIWFDDSLLRLGLNWKECVVLVISICVLFFISYKQEKGLSIRKWISSQHIVVRWSIYLLAIWTIWIMGSYGFGFDAKDFIYGGF